MTMSDANTKIGSVEPHSHIPSEGEKEAMAILNQEGWSVRELAMVFEIKHQTVSKYLQEQGVEP